MSVPYVPGKRSERYWTEAELDVVRRHFADKGARFCASKLPGRGISAIYRTAGKLGIVSNHRGQRRGKIEITPELDALIREEWLKFNGKTKGGVEALATKLLVPRHWLSQRALKLGLTVPRMTKEPPWSPAELELLGRVPLHNLKRAAQIFRDHDFVRTPAALMAKSKRLGMSRRYDETLSATQAAKILGVHAKTVTALILKGALNAVKRETQRTAQQGGDPWSIPRADFRQWIIDNLEIIDIRKADKFAFVDLLTRAEPAKDGAA